ncbi:MAG: hypothetical protein WCC64_20130 [Aliidongia sp.]
MARPSLTLNRNQIFLSVSATLLVLAASFYTLISTLPGNAVLTEDELWAASLANLSFLKSIAFVVRFDNHPPLYYMRLNLWALA